MFPFDHRENIRKSLVCCFQVNQEGTLERKRLTQDFEKKKKMLIPKIWINFSSEHVVKITMHVGLE